MPREDYAEFVEKFKPKSTTDDCYTPEPVYEEVVRWCESEYGVERSSIVRPFFPGGGTCGGGTDRPVFQGAGDRPRPGCVVGA